MANGPLGGFMPTPPAPGQPPQVSLNTSAESRGKFNSFLGTLPKNGAMTPIQTGVGLSSPMPVSPIAGNVNIFEPQMSQMAPMPMTPSGKPVQNFFFGGSAMSGGGFSDAEIGSQMDDFDSGDEDTSDSFDANMGLSDQEVENIIGGGDDQSIALPTPRPQILLDAVGRAENEIFGGTESDALGFFNKSGGLSDKGQKAFEESIAGNLAALQDPPDQVAPSGGGLQLASLLDSSILGNAKNTTPGEINSGVFGINPTTTDTKTKTVLDDLKLDDLNLLNQRPDVLSTRTSLPALPSTTLNVSPIGEQRAGSRGDIVTPDAPFGAAPTTPGRLQAEFGSTLGAGILTPEEVGRATRRGQRDTEDFVSAMRMPGLAAPLSQFTNIAPPPVPVVPQDMQDIITQDENLARIEREQQAIQDARNTGRPQFNLGPGQRGVDLQQSSPSFARGMANIASVTPEFDLETMRGRRDRLPDQVFDIPTNFGVIDRTPDLDASRSFIGTNIDPEAYTGPRKDVPNVGMIGGRRDPTPDTGEPVADLTLDDARAMGDITQERVADILNRPEAFKSTFKVGDVEFPNLLATLANKAGSFFDRRLFDGIVSKGLDAVVDPDTGRIIGAKDEFGNLIEGRDLEQFQAGDDNEDPVTKFLKKATEDEKEEEEDKPPNVIGGGVPVPVRDPVPTVVKSKFPASTASFSPVGFDSGSLNDLIARITGVPAPRRLQDGGVISSVDNFLTKVA